MLYSIEGICLGDSKSEVLEKWGVPDEITFWGTAEWLVYSGERLVRLAPAGLEMTGVLEVEGRTLELDGQKLLSLNDLPEDARRTLGKPDSYSDYEKEIVMQFQHPGLKLYVAFESGKLDTVSLCRRQLGG